MKVSITKRTLRGKVLSGLVDIGSVSFGTVEDWAHRYGDASARSAIAAAANGRTGQFVDHRGCVWKLDLYALSKEGRRA